MENKKEYTLEDTNGTLTITFNNWANQATRSLLVSQNDTVVFVSVVMGSEEKDLNYFPLSVDYEERFYSVGAILGGRYLRREGRPADQAVLNGRIIDRCIRPLFNASLRKEVQVVVMPISIGSTDPVALGVLGVSTALATSHIPWDGPISGISMTRNAINTRATDDEELLFVCGNEQGINMIESNGKEINEEEYVQWIEQAHKELQAYQEFQKKIVSGEKVKKQTIEKKNEVEIPKDIQTRISDTLYKEHSVKKATDIWKQQREQGKKEFDEEARVALDAFLDEEICKQVVTNKKRIDGRGLHDIRPLHAEVGSISKRLHGSGYFERGGTHVMSVVTLGGAGDVLLLDTVDRQNSSKHFLLHYNFPPYSTGEVGRLSGTNRRMIGHGALAEKALRAVLPNQSDFPYTVRLVCESMASNGSTSMGSVCAGSLALMDGGVPITNPVVGIAIGVMKHKETYTLVTDIEGAEDQHSGMDFKIAGTHKGITAMQMDTKLPFVPVDILVSAIQHARTAHTTILTLITSTIQEPRATVSQHAPFMKMLMINPELIGKVVGSGGSTIKKIKEDTQVDDITIADDGSVSIAGKQEYVEKAYTTIHNMTKEFSIGDEAEGKIISIKDFGAFAQIDNTGTEGLIHISEFAPTSVAYTEDVVSIGDVVPVVVKEIKEGGKIGLSVKDRDPNFFGKIESKVRHDRRPQQRRPDSGRFQRRPHERTGGRGGFTGNRDRRPREGNRDRRPRDGHRDRRPNDRNRRDHRR